MITKKQNKLLTIALQKVFTLTKFPRRNPSEAGFLSHQ